MGHFEALGEKLVKGSGGASFGKSTPPEFDWLPKTHN